MREKVRGSSVSSLSRSYRVADFFVVRSPLFPIDRLSSWLHSDGANMDPTAASGGERTKLERRLFTEFLDPTLRNAVFFASPEVYEALPGLRTETTVPPKLERSLLRYFLRATGRETPFGAFAGNSLGRVGAEDNFELPARQDYRLRTRISFAFLTQVMAALGAREDVRDDVPHEPNSSLSVIRENYRVAVDEAETLRGRRLYSSTVTEVRRTPALDRALKLSRGGRTLSSIANEMLEPGRELVDLIEFCRSLSATKLLVPVWLPTATGSDVARVSARHLEGVPRLQAVRGVLTAATAALEAADRAGLTAGGDGYRVIHKSLLELQSPPSNTQPLQTDLVKPAPRLTLSEQLAGRFLAAAQLLQRFSRPRIDTALVEFRRRFGSRYDRRLVPLTEALDGDLGIGFGATETHAADGLLAGLPFAPPRDDSNAFDAFDHFRLRVLERALTLGSQTVALEQELLELLPEDTADSAPSCESFAVIARLARNVEGRTLLVVPELFGPSAIPLLGRFCETYPELHAAVKSHAELEQQLAGDTILTDVAYCPSDDSANVVARPVLRRCEIPCGGGSGAPKEQQLPISDLLVGIDGARVCLYSRRLRKRLAIRLANAHNYDQTSLPTLYRFLGSLQTQDCTLTSRWTWGALDGAAFLPRVTSGDTVLSLARWTVSEREWNLLFAARTYELKDRVRELRAARGLPRWVTRSEFDRRLTVDLENPLSVDELMHEARQHRELVLEELLPAHDQLVLRGPEGAYAAQFVVPFVRRSGITSQPVEHASFELSHAESRQRVPGSDWLYARVYAARSRHCVVLRALRDGAIAASLGSVADLWFYIPFADPEPHLRIRFRGSPADLRGVLLARLECTLRPLIADGSVFRWELGTYDPEIERYGGPVGLELAERLFFADSDAAIQLVSVAGDDDELRWQLALVGIDRLFADCGADIPRRGELAQRASEAYGIEMGATTATWKAIGKKYRQHEPVISRWLRENPSTDALDRTVQTILAERSARVASIWSEIEKAAGSGRMHIPADEQLLLTFAHLHALRVLGTGGRAHEIVLYEFLRRQYAARRSAVSKEHDIPSTV